MKRRDFLRSIPVLGSIAALWRPEPAVAEPQLLEHLDLDGDQVVTAPPSIAEGDVLYIESMSFGLLSWWAHSGVPGYVSSIAAEVRLDTRTDVEAFEWCMTRRLGWASIVADRGEYGLSDPCVRAWEIQNNIDAQVGRVTFTGTELLLMGGAMRQ